MKAKHNKKRNTAFIFEALSREVTKAIIENDERKKKAVTSIVRSYFKRGTELRKELDLYRNLNESSECDKDTANRILQEVKRDYGDINKKKLFKEQTAMINTINKKLSKAVFSNFVGNYKYLATISQIFNKESDAKNRVLLEDTVLDTMTRVKEDDDMKPVDNIVYKSFVSKFNEEYSSVLPDDQKELLGKYVSSFADNGVEFKLYMNEEIGRLKKKVTEALDCEEVTGDADMKNSTKEVYNLLENSAKKPIDEELVRQVLNIQNFVREVES